MRTNLAEDPDVIGLAATLGFTENEAVGLLLKFWGWADQHTIDGNAHSVTKKWIDRFIGVVGFADFLESIGWLDVLDNGVSIPNWDAYMSKSAKERLLTRRRVKKHRAKGNEDVTPEALLQQQQQQQNSIEECNAIADSPREPLKKKKKKHRTVPRCTQKTGKYLYGVVEREIRKGTIPGSFASRLKWLSKGFAIAEDETAREPGAVLTTAIQDGEAGKINQVHEDKAHAYLKSLNGGGHG